MDGKNSLIQTVHNREIAHHDEWAEGTAVADVQVRESFESLTSFEGKYVMELMGDIRGKKLLDVGCGLGESSVYFALQGANVVAMDISPQMIEKTMETATFHGVEGNITGMAVSAETMQLPERDFDIVYAANVLHHVVDLEGTLKVIHDSLKPGGWFISWDPIAYNPVINVYRRMTVGGNRTEDEHPLTFDQLDTFRKYFVEVAHREFWLSTLTIFLKYYLCDRLDPNEVKYWKKIYTESEETIGWWFKPLISLDGMLMKIPGLNYLAWNTVISARKAPQ